MKLPEKAAYLKGLCEGLGIDTDKKEGKLLYAIIDMLEDVANEIANLEENALALGDEIDELSDDLADVEDALFDDEDDDDDDEDEDDECCCGHHRHRHHGGHHHHHGDDCDCEDIVFEVKCPACQYELIIDEDILAEGFVLCPGCGEKLEFDTSLLEDEGEENPEE